MTGFHLARGVAKLGLALKGLAQEAREAPSQQYAADDARNHHALPLESALTVPPIRHIDLISRDPTSL